MTFKALIQKILWFLQIIRYDEWQDKIFSHLWAVFLIFIFSGGLSNHAHQILIYIVYLFCAFCFGFLINSYFDYALDIRVEKIKPRDIPVRIVGGLSFIFGLLSLILPFLYKNLFINILNIYILISAFLYSARCLKAKGLGGLLVASMTQRMPILFFFFLLPDVRVLIVYLWGWSILMGLLIEIGHQVSDRDFDGKASLGTFVLIAGIRKTKKIIFTTCAVLLGYCFLPWLLFSMNNFLLSILLLIYTYHNLAQSHRNMGLIGLMDKDVKENE